MGRIYETTEMEEKLLLIVKILSKYESCTIFQDIRKPAVISDVTNLPWMQRKQIKGRNAWSKPSRANQPIYIYSGTRGPPSDARSRNGTKTRRGLAFRKTGIDSCLWSVPDPIKWPQARSNGLRSWRGKKKREGQPTPRKLLLSLYIRPSNWGHHE